MDLAVAPAFRRLPARDGIRIHNTTRMIAASRQQESLNISQRWISLSEFLLGGAIVIAHNVYHRIPNEVPILFVLGWVSIWRRDGGWKTVGLRKPDSWRKTVLWGVLAGILIIAAGQLADFVGAKIWHQAAKGPAVLKEAKTTWKAALFGLGVVWTFAAFGEEMGYRGYLMTRAADVGNRSKLAYAVALLASSVLFGYGHYY